MSELDFSTIPAPSRKCVLCNQDLAAGSKHPTVLQVSEKGSPLRRDVCPQCWEKMNEHEFFSFWLTRREAAKPEPAISREEQNRRLLAMFDQMRDAGEDRLRPHLYVLAHTLMKRRVLKYEGTRKGENGIERISFRSMANNERIEIEEVEIPDETMVAIVREIERATTGEAPAAPAASGSGGVV